MLKSFFIFLFIGTEISLFVQEMVENDSQIVLLTAREAGEVVIIVTLMFSFVLTILDRRLRKHNSEELFLFYLFFLMCKILSLYSIFEKKYINDSNEWYKTDYYEVATSFITLIIFFLHCFADLYATRQEYQSFDSSECPELRASVPSLLTFAWLTPLVFSGYRKALEMSKLWSLLPNYKTKSVTDKFIAVVDKEVKGNRWVFCVLCLFWFQRKFFCLEIFFLKVKRFLLYNVLTIFSEN